MKIRLREIELGSSHVQKSTAFFAQILGCKPTVQEDLTVFDAGLQGLELNLSIHLSPAEVTVSFLTDDLAAMQQKLQAAGMTYEGPSSSHLGMQCLPFKSPDGYLIKVNTPTSSSPNWLKV